MRKITKWLLIISVLFIAGCGAIKPYEVDIQQGNVLDKKTISKLHTGMTKEQVVDLMGSPVLGDAFCENRWSYVYTNQINGGKITEQKLDLDFSQDKLVLITLKNE
jgi:outer membrane protein assembly factor BamE